MTDVAMIDHENLALLASWLADQGYSASEVAYAVAKPWKYPAELAAAKAERDNSME